MNPLQDISYSMSDQIMFSSILKNKHKLKSKTVIDGWKSSLRSGLKSAFSAWSRIFCSESASLPASLGINSRSDRNLPCCCCFLRDAGTEQVVNATRIPHLTPHPHLCRVDSVKASGISRHFQPAHFKAACSQETCDF